MTIAAINPFFGLLTAKIIEEELKKRKWDKLRNDLYYLKRRGFIKVDKSSDGSYRIRPTDKGKDRVKKVFLEDVSIKIPKKWDGYWRLVVFDIPAVKKQARYALLAKLKELGFIMVQRSIWAHPFECKKEIAVLSRAFGVERYIHQITCHEISAGEDLRYEFEKRNSVKLV